MNEQTLGQRIAAQRKKLGLSQEALGDKMGVSRQAISKWESDGAVPEIDKLIAMSKLFGVTLGWLLGVEEEVAAEPAPGFTDEQLELIRRMIPQPAQPKKAPWIVATIFSAAALIIAMFCQPKVPNYGSDIQHLQNELQNLRSSVNSLVLQQEAMMEENAEVLLLDHNVTFGGIQEDDTARVLFSATPKEWAPGQTASLSVLRNGEKVAEAPCTIDGAVCTASVDLPLADGYEYHFVTTDAEGNQKFQYLDNGNCNYLQSDTSLLVESWIIPDAAYRRNKLHILGLEIAVSQPLLSEKYEAPTWTRLDYVISINGQDVRRESFLDSDLVEATDFTVSESDLVFSDITLNNGDQVWLSVDVALKRSTGERLTLATWTYQNGSLN